MQILLTKYKNVIFVGDQLPHSQILRYNFEKILQFMLQLTETSQFVLLSSSYVGKTKWTLISSEFSY